MPDLGLLLMVQPCPPACPSAYPLDDVVPVRLEPSDYDRLDDVFALVREIAPEDADEFDDARLLRFALELAAEQAREFAPRLRRMRAATA